MSEEVTQLVVIENQTPSALFVPGGLDAVISQIEEVARSFPQDMDTAKGRREIASVASRVAKTKTFIDDLGKGYVAELKRRPKEVDAVRKDMRDRLDALRDEIRAPLTAWEEDRKQKREARSAAVSRIKMLGLSDGPGGELLPTAALREQMDALMRMQDPNTWKDDPLWEDIKAEAIEAYRNSKVLLGAALVMAEKRDEDAAKAAAEKQAQLEAQIRERVERETLEAAAAIGAAKAERDKVEQFQPQPQLQPVSAEERDGYTALHAGVERSRARDYRAERHRSVVISLVEVTGISEGTAERIVEAIARGEVDHVSISY